MKSCLREPCDEVPLFVTLTKDGGSGVHRVCSPSYDGISHIEKHF